MLEMKLKRSSLRGGILLLIFLFLVTGIFAQNSGLFPVSNNRKYGYIDKTGKMIIKPQFDYATVFSEGMAHAKIEGKRGFIDKTGKFIWQSS